jgi:hypothetical protein
MKNLIHKIQSDEKLILIILSAFTLLIRSVYVYMTYHTTGTTKWADDWLYLSYGEQLAKGNWAPVSDGYPYMLVGPFLPLLIAFFIKIFADPVVPVFIFNIIASAIVVPILYYLGKEIFSEKIGWLIAIWGVFNLEFFKYTPHIVKEPTIFLLVPLTLLFLIRSIKTHNHFSYLIFSVVSFTLLIHTDERFFIYLPVFILAFLLIEPLNIKRAFKLGGMWVGLVFLSLVPWGIRNYSVFDQVVILSPRTTAFTSKIWGDNLAKLPFAEGYEVDRSDYENALQFGKENGITPREYGKLERHIKAFLNFWQPTYFNATYIQYGFRPQKWSSGHNTAGLLFYGMFLPFYLLGIILLIRKKYSLGLFLASIPVIHSLLHAFMIWPLERYRSPVTFIVVMIGLWAIFHVHEIIKKRIIQKSSNRMK